MVQSKIKNAKCWLILSVLHTYNQPITLPLNDLKIEKLSWNHLFAILTVTAQKIDQPYELVTPKKPEFELTEHATETTARLKYRWPGKISRGGGALEWQEGVSGSSMDSQKAP